MIAEFVCFHCPTITELELPDGDIDQRKTNCESCDEQAWRKRCNCGRLITDSQCPNCGTTLGISKNDNP